MADTSVSDFQGTMKSCMTGDVKVMTDQVLKSVKSVGGLVDLLKLHGKNESLDKVRNLLMDVLEQKMMAEEPDAETHTKTKASAETAESMSVQESAVTQSGYHDAVIDGIIDEVVANLKSSDSGLRKKLCAALSNPQGCSELTIHINAEVNGK